MIENGFLIPYKEKYEEIPIQTTHLETVCNYFYGLCDKLGTNNALSMLNYENESQALMQLSSNKSVLKMIEKLGWIEISKNVGVFICTGLTKELEIYWGGMNKQDLNIFLCINMKILKKIYQKKNLKHF